MQDFDRAVLARIDKFSANKKLVLKLHPATKLEIDWIGLELPARIELGQCGVRILPDQQHRALRREPLMADIGGHRRDVTSFHRHARARRTGLSIRHVPDYFIAQLNEPFDSIVAMD